MVYNRLGFEDKENLHFLKLHSPSHKHLDFGS